MQLRNSEIARMMHYNRTMQISDTIRQKITDALEGLGVTVSDRSVVLEHPSDLSKGDYATGVALAYAKEAGKNPRALAEELVQKMGALAGVSKIEVAGPGFINFYLSPQALVHANETARTQDMWGSSELSKREVIMVEYTDPNPFKAFHIGHLMSNAIGESIARLYQFSGAAVIRANYQGDVGVHVACAIWGIQQLGINPESADQFGEAYAKGATAYKEDEGAKKEIDDINKKLYERTDPELNSLYDTGRKKSLEAFEKIYELLGTKFDHYFFESEVAPIGKEIVLAHPELFPESDGARVFKGEEYGLHTRVFINARGLPTYEGKELGLEKLKKDLYPQTTKLIIVTANEISEYFKVIKKAMGLVYPDIATQLEHVPHGILKLPEGKMSSRTGKVVTGESLIEELKGAAEARASESRADNPDQLAEAVAVAAVKYQVLKQTSGKDIIFDRERALSLEGDSGPYLQYAHARARQIMEKGKATGVEAKFDITEDASIVARLIFRFPEIIGRATVMREPHILTNYLLELGSSFNSWYAQEQVIDGTANAPHKLAIVEAFARTMKNGLWVLGIPAPEKM
jgi:arginyl-tRNA synthetase